jgi:predicted acetyltransferase
MKIRQIRHDERADLSIPVQAYGFLPSPTSAETVDTLRNNQQYYEHNVTLVAEDDNGAILAEATAIPMSQNVRGTIYPMAGIAGVASLPLSRRQGHVRSVMLELLGRMRDDGYVVSTLYPFRASFYQRFGYVGLPKARTVTFAPTAFVDLLHTDLDGTVSWQTAREGYDAFRALTRQLGEQRHGFAVLPDYRTVELRDNENRWLVTARSGDAIVGSMAYRITGHGGELVGDDLLSTGPLGRALILRFIALHIDHVDQVTTTIAPDEMPELWATDLVGVTETRTSFPTAPAPMARVLSMDALRGMAVGRGRITVEIVDDPFVAGRYALDGMTDALDVESDRTSTPNATLTVAGLTGLVYGVLTPEDVVVRGLGVMSDRAVVALAALFRRATPYLHARF